MVGATNINMGYSKQIIATAFNKMIAPEIDIDERNIDVIYDNFMNGLKDAYKESLIQPQEIKEENPLSYGQTIIQAIDYIDNADSITTDIFKDKLNGLLPFAKFIPICIEDVNGNLITTITNDVELTIVRTLIRESPSDKKLDIYCRFIDSNKRIKIEHDGTTPDASNDYLKISPNCLNSFQILTVYVQDGYYLDNCEN
jgi:hypothetical protein